MKISNEPETIEITQDLFNIILEFQKQYRTVYWVFLDGQMYVYKPIGRKDYKEVCSNENLDNLDKEDELIRRSLLYPENLDPDNLIAGVAKNLFNEILKNSFLENTEIRTNVLNYFRSEMYDMQNQITCLINEAFPNYDIEEIENWGIERTAKYLSRAEWKLQNLRGMVFNEQYFATQSQIDNDKQNNDQQEIKNKESINSNNNSNNKIEKNKKRERLTPEKLAELKRNFPEIDWEHDTLMSEGEDAMYDNVDTVAPALRTPDMIRKKKQ